mgnify:CR=1 FL=1
MTATSEATMAEVDARVMAQVRRLVANGVEEREAVARTCRAMMAQWPAVAVAYLSWMAAKA